MLVSLSPVNLNKTVTHFWQCEHCSLGVAVESVSNRSEALRKLPVRYSGQNAVHTYNVCYETKIQLRQHRSSHSYFCVRCLHQHCRAGRSLVWLPPLSSRARSPDRGQDAELRMEPRVQSPDRRPACGERRTGSHL